MEYDKEVIKIYTSSELRMIMSDFGGRIGLPCFIALVYGIVRSVKLHSCDWQGLIIIIGAIMSFIGCITYGITVQEYEKYNKRNWRSFIFSLLGFIPYLLGCFLIFYKGFWAFGYLFNSFSSWGLIAPIIWILLGYRIISQLYLMTELGRLISEGKIKIEKNNE